MPVTDIPVAGQGNNGGSNLTTLYSDPTAEIDSTFVSLPNSQATSSTESAASQLSQQHLVSQNTSQSSVDHANTLQAEIASAQTLSAASTVPGLGNSSQSQGLIRQLREGNARLQPILPALDIGRVAQEQYQPNGAHGQKRTASGHVKTPSSSQATSPVETLNFGHSRHPSSASSSTQIGELSAQLRTRLSYAMLKVQNGWQTKTIDEVESLTSQHGSPISALASPKQPSESPGTNVMQIYHEKGGFAESSERTTAPSERALTAPHTHQSMYGQKYTSVQGPRVAYSPATRSVDQTYPYLSRHGLKPLEPGPSLAPPVDFGPRNPRRSNQSQAHAQPLHMNGTRNFSNLSTSSTSSARSTVPATPPQKRPPAIKTPSQKATAMEKDAIETLLFMSSPGNSQRHPNSQLSGTPLRSTFLPAEKHVGFLAGEDVIPISPRKRGLLDSVHLETDENIDKLLDQMPDGNSSSEDEMMVSPRPRQMAYS